MEGLDAISTQELKRADLAELPPVGSVWRERYVRAVVRHDLDCQQRRAGGEDQVVRFHDLLGDVGGGDDDGGDMA